MSRPTVDVPSEDLVAGVYETFAKTYDKNRTQFDLTEVLTDFRKPLPDVGVLLDLGCGAGEPVAKTFADDGWRVIGVDFSKAMLDLAGRHVPEMTRLQADMRTLSFAEESFDAITAVYSLFHVPWEDHPRIFTNMRRWLKPGGQVLFTYATRAYTGKRKFSGTKEFMGQELFYSHTTKKELREQLSKAGLKVVRAKDRSIGGETFMWVTAKIKP